MKNEFIGFYMPSEKELAAAWRSSKTKFIFDTNVLLKLYSYQPNTLNDFFSILTKLGDKIWIPHQVGLEFQNRRLDIKAKEKQKFSDLEKQLDDLLKIENKINQLFLKGRFPELDSATTDLFNKIRPLIDEYKKVLNHCNESQPNIRAHDSIRAKIDDCFKGKVGSAFSKEELEEIYKEGEKRYENKIPPGFKDSTKNSGADYFYKGIEYKRKFGDLILWKQIIEKAKDENIKNVIFITDDEKEDWWYIAKENGDKAIGPLANITHEIIEKGHISLFHMYNTSAFFQAAKEFASVKVQDGSINEIKRIHENESKPKKLLSLESFDGEIADIDSTSHMIKSGQLSPAYYQQAVKRAMWDETKRTRDREKIERMMEQRKMIERMMEQSMMEQREMIERMMRQREIERMKRQREIERMMRHNTTMENKNLLSEDNEDIDDIDNE
ncbi:PIN-like domain-containing protein [Neisseria weaveri]|uniref:PIN-like domain-containing protein n=1 Tax=Neisseria weaveri TaxID=28091 RepID=UPI0002231D4E|nr:PIN-like domain-containing protein [Neisseria weaveri]EGV38539.1 hypothetical protein l13_00720 [Neisseria weaveri ATCC 51223]